MTKNILQAILILMMLSALDMRVASQGQLNVGLAKIIITPEENIWMAGYAARKKPAEGKINDLYAKAVALTDGRGDRVVLVTADLLGFPRALTTAVSEESKIKFGLKREQILFNASHTHSGPVLTGSLIGAYDLNQEQTVAVARYTDQLKGKLVTLIGKAIDDLAPAKISFGRGSASFGMNRRQMTPKGMTNGVSPDGVVDHEVPILRIESTSGATRGIIFGYACHNTTLTGDNYLYSGDYAGFAQEALENAHPGTIALFVMGCGGDVNPAPRSKLELAREHGDTLAKSVEKVLSGSMSDINGIIKSVIGEIPIPFATPPTRKELEAQLKSDNDYQRRHAERMLQRMDRDGKLISEYPYTIQIIQIGDMKFFGLAGEVVTDYSLRLKRELKGDVWIAGYSNDLCSYIPSARMYNEGGYEVIESMIYYDLPGPYKPELEEKIIGKAHELSRSLELKKE